MAVDIYELFFREKKFSYALASFPFLCRNLEVMRKPLPKNGLEKTFIKEEFRKRDEGGRAKMLGIYQSYNLRNYEEEVFISRVYETAQNMINHIINVGAIVPLFPFLQNPFFDINPELISVCYDPNQSEYIEKPTPDDEKFYKNLSEVARSLIKEAESKQAVPKEKRETPKQDVFLRYIRNEDICGRLAINTLENLANPYKKKISARLYDLYDKLCQTVSRGENVDPKNFGSAAIFFNEARNDLLPYGLTREEFVFLFGIKNEYEIHIGKCDS